MKRMLSGIKPTGKLTLGNYIGAIREFIKYQDEYEMFIFIANLHAITVPNDPKELRKNKTIRFIMATSFASILIEKLNINSFIVHLWGISGNGKTVTLMIAMSIWGNPGIGHLVKNLNSTSVGFERLSTFLYNIPFAGDELQTIKNKWDSFDNLIMYLTEGIDRGRGQQFGGIETLNTWNCNFIF